MGLADSYRNQDPTHRLVVRRQSGVDDTDPTGLIAVENRVVSVAMAFGSAVHLCLEQTLDGDCLANLRNRLQQLPADERVLENDVPEYWAELPAQAGLVERSLAVPDGATDAWLDRLHGLAELAVVTGETWLYRSVPHETHIREINAEAADGYLSALHAELSAVPTAAIGPHGPLASWETDEWEYKLSWDVLLGRQDGGSWQSTNLKRLRRIKPLPERSEIVFQWTAPSDVSRVVGGLRRVVGGAGEFPPTRLGVPTDDLRAVVAAFAELRDRLDYAFEIVE